jgi:hypothetical protein
MTQHKKIEKRLLLVGASVFVFCQNSNEKSESEVIFGLFNNTEKSAKVR